MMLDDSNTEPNMTKQRQIPSPLELLYESYTEYHSIDNDVIREQFQELRAHYRHLSDREFDDLFSQVSGLCYAHEHAAFQEGVRLGVRLAGELMRW